MFFGKNKIKNSRSPVVYTDIDTPQRCSPYPPSVRRTFLFSSFGFSRKFADEASHKFLFRVPSSLKGSLTLEAALVLPLYMFFLISIIYILNILYLQNIFQAAMEEAARSVSSYAYAAAQFEELSDAERSSIGSQDASFVVKLARNQLGKTALSKSFFTDNIKNAADSSYIKNGYKGIIITLGNSSLNEYVDFKISYSVRLPFLPDEVFYIPITQRCYFKPFTGVDIDGTTGDFTQYVYVTATGNVYHTSPYCTYLNSYYYVVSEEEMNVTWDTAVDYQPCTYCAFGKPIGPTSFLCPGSKVYHSTTSCFHIGVTIYKIPMDQVGITPMCSRCKKGVSK